MQPPTRPLASSQTFRLETLHTTVTQSTSLMIVHALFFSLLTATTLPQPKGDRAVFDIANDIIAEKPSRFGANIEPPAMSHWNTEPWHNQWWLGPNINPMTIRLKGTASGGDATSLEANEGWRLGYYDVFRDGFFDGADILVYRFENGQVSLLRRGKVKTYQASKDGPNRLEFTEPGPPIQAGDEWFLTHERLDVPQGTTRPWDTAPWWKIGSFSFVQGTEKTFHDAGVTLDIVPDPSPNGGRASLKMTIPEGLTDTPRLGNWFLAGEQDDWPRLREGATYTVRLWLKHEGMAEPSAEVRVAHITTQTLQPTTEWQEFTFDFIGSPPPDRNPYRFDIGSKQPGALFIDNVTIVEKDGPPPFTFYPHVIDTLKRFQPSSLRLWSLQQNRGFGKRLDDALGLPATANLTFRETNGAATTVPVGLHQELELCAEVGANPWIITSVMFTPEENLNLIEYLAGPPDSPYGAKRAALGRTQPWTETFSQILIEPGNEVWNGSFGPQHFSNRPEFYGAYADFIFRTMKSSPHYRDGSFFFIVNGWVANTGPGGYGAKALAHAPNADAFDIAYYTGGWDSVGLMKADSLDESWMNILTFSRRMLFERSRLAAQTAAEIGRNRGRPASALVYEAGPGYTLPGPGKFDIEEQRQGKSLAHAINALDIFMTNLREGLGDQSFFMFKNGHYWASHNRTWGEHIAWKALGLRNTLLLGDLITATPTQMVTLDLPETQADVVSQTKTAHPKDRSVPPV
ncbi:MAG: hypothetical protein SNJ84_03915, partial [Verrucomicrobiia bacterium]